MKKSKIKFEVFNNLKPVVEVIRRYIRRIPTANLVK